MQDSGVIRSRRRHLAALALSLPLLSVAQRSTLSWILVSAVIAFNAVFLLGFAPQIVDRARLTEATSLLGHARKDMVVELALRPSHAVVGGASPLDLPVTASKGPQSLTVRYERNADQLVAHMASAASQGVWKLEPSTPKGELSWVVNWRCRADTTGRLREIGQVICPQIPDAKSP